MLATAPVTRPSRESMVPAAHRCPYCRLELAYDAKKCGACGEWVVGTSGGFAAAMLRLLGWLWTALTLAAAAGLWLVGQGARRWVLLHAVDPEITPVVFDAVLYGIVGLLLLQGLTVGVGLGVLARLAPRRPRWWS